MQSVTAEQLCGSYDSSIIVRRWGATLLDTLVLGGLGFAALSLPERFQIPAVSAAVGFLLAYYPIFEGFLGATVGKLVVGIRVVDEDGQEPAMGKILVRTAFRLIEVNPFVFGGIPAGLIAMSSKKRQRLGDMVAGTFVVKREDLRRLVARSALPVGEPVGSLEPVVPAGTDWLVPSGRSGWAIAAGYLGLLSLLFVPAPLAIAAGVMALRDLRRHPELGGRGRAYFGLVMGCLGTALLIVSVVTVAMSEGR